MFGDRESRCESVRIPKWNFETVGDAEAGRLEIEGYFAARISSCSASLFSNVQVRGQSDAERKAKTTVSALSDEEVRRLEAVGMVWEAR